MLGAVAALQHEAANIARASVKSRVDLADEVRQRLQAPRPLAEPRDRAAGLLDQSAGQLAALFDPHQGGVRQLAMLDPQTGRFAPAVN